MLKKIENININEEINNKENNENNNENEKEYERKFDNSQSDNVSIQSIVSNNSAKKSNQSTASKKIRGFNFRNNIKIRKYSGKYNTSNNDNNKK